MTEVIQFYGESIPRLRQEYLTTAMVRKQALGQWALGRKLP